MNGMGNTLVTIDSRQRVRSKASGLIYRLERRDGMVYGYSELRTDDRYSFVVVPNDPLMKFMESM